MTLRPVVRLLSATALPFLSIAIASPASAATWSVAKDNIATVLMGVDFQDASNGYVVGADNAAGGSVIFHTSDGGRTFINQQDNPLQCATYLDVSYGGDGNALSGGLGMFYRFAGASYSDDGRNWKASKDRWLASVYQDVEAVDADHMFMVGAWSKLTTYSDGVAASTDGGRTFNYFPWGIDTAARYGSFVSPSVGYVSGGQWPYEETVAKFGKGDHRLSQHVRVPGKNLKRDPQSLTYDGYRGVIAKTVNGGESWELIYDDYDRFYFNAIDFVDEDTGWVVAEGDAGGYILHTSDGGQTWEEQHFEDGASLLGLKMIDENEGWATGAIISRSYEALFLHTVDGGMTWEAVDTGLGKYYVFNLDFVDSEHGFATALSPAGAASILKFAP